MVVTVLRGALGFLTRLRVGHSERAWAAFRESPWAFPLAGYVVGALLAVPFVFDALPPGTVALAYLAAVLVVTGINHLDGVADVGDALVVHGDSEERTRVLKDTTVGVGAVAAIAVAVAGLALGALGVAGLPTRAAIAVVVATEIGAKVGMAAVACLGTAAHEGLGSQFTERANSRDLLPAVLVAIPAVVLSWPTPAAAVAIVGAALAGLLVLWRLESLLDGVNGDVFGAVNEVGRVVGLHLGVVVWTLY
ncbi:adenosylcobinamide-GDP ribazoletransferase [Halobacterium sp. KA-6]|uniref:adenosylcobinamide-GDP ribazoletransferase n=1 Tax=Halobacterium sp. KA-6 TaxID=2896368 RepID=UPI001E3584FE|nr:adenosylcobinamide-GDP ribazoletransferase [Halobacterium sp. KA-6]MCD2204286.1 adenosylcobinamide-GDP ribazoletransferase [Halobacterium sp. KA-6]